MTFEEEWLNLHKESSEKDMKVLDESYKNGTPSEGEMIKIRWWYKQKAREIKQKYGNDDENDS